MLRAAGKHGQYQISGARAVDGDTIEAVIHLPFQTLACKRIRLAGWWAPETRGPDAANGLMAKANLDKYLGTNPCGIFCRAERLDKYGRIIASLYSNGKVVDPSEVLGVFALTEAQHFAAAKALKAWDASQGDLTRAGYARKYPPGGEDVERPGA